MHQNCKIRFHPVTQSKPFKSLGYFQRKCKQKMNISVTIEQSLFLFFLYIYIYISFFYVPLIIGQLKVWERESGRRLESNPGCCQGLSLSTWGTRSTRWAILQQKEALAVLYQWFFPDHTQYDKQYVSHFICMKSRSNTSEGSVFVNQRFFNWWGGVGAGIDHEQLHILFSLHLKSSYFV